MDRLKYKICYTQGRIFAYAVKLGYDIRTFCQEYLTSHFCERQFDTLYSRYQLESEIECMDFILPEIEKKLVKADEKPNEEKARFVGIIYRYLYYVTGISSANLIEKIPYEEVEKQYWNSNQKSDDWIIEDICKKFNLEITDDKYNEIG